MPPTTKQELMTNFDRAVTDPAIRRDDVEKFMSDKANLGRLFRGRYCVSHTSGSQGQPLLLVQDRRCLDILFGISATRADARGRPGLREGMHRLFHPTRLAVVSMVGFSASGHAFTFPPEFAGPFIHMTLVFPRRSRT